ncbi:IS30 family transposase [Sinorhizobium meliloti]
MSAVRVCTETIYRFIYCKEDYALKLYRHLPEGRRKAPPTPLPQALRRLDPV